MAAIRAALGADDKPASEHGQSHAGKFQPPSAGDGVGFLRAGLAVAACVAGHPYTAELLPGQPILADLLATLTMALLYKSVPRLPDAAAAAPAGPASAVAQVIEFDNVAAQMELRSQAASALCSLILRFQMTRPVQQDGKTLLSQLVQLLLQASFAA